MAEELTDDEAKKFMLLLTGGGAEEEKSENDTTRGGGSGRDTKPAPEPAPVDMEIRKLEDLQRAYRDIRAAGAGSDPTDPFDLAAPDKAEKMEEFRKSFGDRPLPKGFAALTADKMRTVQESAKGVSKRVDPPKESSLNLGFVPLAELARMDFADTSGGRDSLVNFVEGRGDSLTIEGIKRYIEAQKTRKNLVAEKREETARKRRSAGPYDDPGFFAVRSAEREGVGSRAGRMVVDSDIKERNRIDKNIKMARDVLARLENVKDLTTATPITEE